MQTVAARMLDILSDELPHTREELTQYVECGTEDKAKLYKAVQDAISDLRKVLHSRGLTIVHTKSPDATINEYQLRRRLRVD